MATSQVNPAEEIRKEINNRKSELNEVIKKSGLPSLREEYSDLDTNIANLFMRITKIRERNYAFLKMAEKQAAEYQQQWTFKKTPILNQINTEANNLRAGLRPLETRISGLQVAMTSNLAVSNLKNDLDNYENRVSAIETNIRGQYEKLKAEVEKLSSEFTEIEETLDLCEAASFGFLPGEAIVAAVKAVWARDGKEKKEDPDGILYLTDQRLIFEQKEEVATKKVLFVTTERELVQQKLFETPVVSVESIKATKQGLFKNEDWIELVLATGSFAREVNLHLKGQDSELWQRRVTQTKNHEIDADRAIPVDKAAVEKVKSAPTECPNCGGVISAPVLRGQDTIKCEFCGNVIRL